MNHWIHFPRNHSAVEDFRRGYIDEETDVESMEVSALERSKIEWSCSRVKTQINSGRISRGIEVLPEFQSLLLDCVKKLRKDEQTSDFGRKLDRLHNRILSARSSCLPVILFF